MTLALLAPSLARAQGPSEAAVKAAFLVKFGAYVGWPASSGPVTLCMVGRDALGGALDAAAQGERINGRPVRVRSLETVTQASGCDIAYLAGSPRQSVPAALATLKGVPVLTVTDSRWSNARGMIHFQVAQSRVRFHIDDRAAGESGLGLSSKLLGLALSVRPRGGR
jgi:hypothetical protein